ncbi:hypothetical protein ABK040_015622 [Willaertia magna]
MTLLRELRPFFFTLLFISITYHFTSIYFTKPSSSISSSINPSEIHSEQFIDLSQEHLTTSSSFFVLSSELNKNQSSTNICVKGNIDAINCCPPPYDNISRKSKLTTFLLSFFLGFFGVDRFYLEFYLMGIIKLITFGGVGIWWLLDWILILVGNISDVRGCALKDDLTPSDY